MNMSPESVQQSNPNASTVTPRDYLSDLSLRLMNSRKFHLFDWCIREKWISGAFTEVGLQG